MRALAKQRALEGVGRREMQAMRRNDWSNDAEADGYSGSETETDNEWREAKYARISCSRKRKGHSPSQPRQRAARLVRRKHTKKTAYMGTAAMDAHAASLLQVFEFRASIQEPVADCFVEKADEAKTESVNDEQKWWMREREKLIKAQRRMHRTLENASPPVFQAI
ncbi:hypothetical protein FI667_g1989, partial [Globisporangium splendens]